MTIAYTPNPPTTPAPGIAEPPPDMPERLLWKLWQRRAERQAEFRTGAGRRVRVLYPGRAASAAGPDFRDALLEVEGLGLVRGDVEIHKRECDWDAHGHGGDPNYNGVALHAALETDTPQTPLASGSSAPVISLSALVENADNDADDDQESAPSGENLWRLLARRGYPQPSGAAETGALLSQAGDERFRRRAAALERFAREQGPEQTLYEALLEGLGYRHNQQPFVKLASRAPIAALRQAARPVLTAQRPMVLRHWLLAISGLANAAPSGQPQFPPGLGPAMARNEWRLFRIRPANHPAARIVGVAELAARSLDRGLLAALSDAAASPAQLTAALTVAATDGKAAPIGPGRARDLAVNAALPLLHALNRSGPQSPYIELYRRFPKLPDNEILREMTQRLLPQPCQAEVNTARRQQGLLHLAALLRGAS